MCAPQAAAEASMGELLRSPDFSRAETKRLLRGEFAAGWVAYATGEGEEGREGRE